MVLLLLVTLCIEVKSFCTCPTPQQFLAVLCFLLLSQVENVSQHWPTPLTWVTLPGTQSHLGILCLYHSYRNVLFNQFFHVICSTAATWTKGNIGEVYVDLRKKEYLHHKWPALTSRQDAMESFSRDVSYTLKKWLLYITWPKSMAVLVTSTKKRHKCKMKHEEDRVYCYSSTNGFL